MAPVLMYGTAACPYCQAARALFSDLGVPFEEIRVDLAPARRKRCVCARADGTRCRRFGLAPSTLGASRTYLHFTNRAPSRRCFTRQLKERPHE